MLPDAAKGSGCAQQRVLFVFFSLVRQRRTACRRIAPLLRIAGVSFFALSETQVAVFVVLPFLRAARRSVINTSSLSFRTEMRITSRFNTLPYSLVHPLTYGRFKTPLPTPGSNLIPHSHPQPPPPPLTRCVFFHAPLVVSQTPPAYFIFATTKKRKKRCGFGPAQDLRTFEANPQFSLYLSHLMAHPSSQVKHTNLSPVVWVLIDVRMM